MMAGTSVLCRSTCEIRRARARWSPASILFTTFTREFLRSVIPLDTCEQQKLDQGHATLKVMGTEGLSGLVGGMLLDVSHNIGSGGAGAKNLLRPLRLEFGDIPFWNDTTSNHQNIMGTLLS